MNVAVKMNEEKGAEIFYLRPLKGPLSPGFPNKKAARSTALTVDISSMCVSKSGYKERVVVPARIVAEAVRLILDAELPPPREPGRDGSNEWTADFDNLTGLPARTPEEREKLPKLPRGFCYDTDAPGPVERSAINRDLEYRSRASLRADCRLDPSAFADAIPHDIADRVTVPNAFDEAHAILSAVSDKRPARAWLHADPDEQVTLVDYTPPPLRLRSRAIPGAVLTRDDGAIKLTLRERDLDLHQARCAAPRSKRSNWRLRPDTIFSFALAESPASAFLSPSSLSERVYPWRLQADRFTPCKR